MTAEFQRSVKQELPSFLLGDPRGCRSFIRRSASSESLSPPHLVCPQWNAAWPLFLHSGPKARTESERYTARLSTTRAHTGSIIPSDSSVPLFYLRPMPSRPVFLFNAGGHGSCQRRVSSSHAETLHLLCPHVGLRGVWVCVREGLLSSWNPGEV